MKLFRIDSNKFLLGWLLLVACEGKEPAATVLEDGKSTVIYDLAGDTQASMIDGVDGKEQRPFYTFLFNFKDKRQIWIRTAQDTAQWLKTDTWDLAFTGNYNSEIFLNNGSQPGNPGYESPASATGIVWVDQPYEQVVTAPSDDVFDRSSILSLGRAEGASPHGWFQYSSTTHVMKAQPNRTYVLRLPDGKYAKLQLLSAYKGNPPAVTDMHWPAPYFTFRYYVQQDGSKNLKTK